MKRAAALTLSGPVTRSRVKSQKISSCKPPSLENISSSTANDVSDSSKSKRLGYSFFNKPAIDLAVDLLGKNLVRVCHNKRLVCKIVETEPYLGGPDKSSHSYAGKITPRNEPMFMPPGTVYVYSTYGMYFCMNFSSAGAGSAVLIRSLEPVEGLDQMTDNRLRLRKSKTNSKLVKLKPGDLCNGPSKLCQSLDIDKSLNKVDLCSSSDLWIENSANSQPFEVLVATRIGLSKCGGWEKALYRFYEKDNPFVSVKDKHAVSLEDAKATNFNVPR